MSNGNLWRIIQKHLDDYGVRASEFARRIGTQPQTVSSWKQRGVHALPSKKLLVGISDVTRRPYDEVLTAALFDAGYLPKDAESTSGTPIGARPEEDPTQPAQDDPTLEQDHGDNLPMGGSVGSPVRSIRGPGPRLPGSLPPSGP